MLGHIAIIAIGGFCAQNARGAATNCYFPAEKVELKGPQGTRYHSPERASFALRENAQTVEFAEMYEFGSDITVGNTVFAQFRDFGNYPRVNMFLRNSTSNCIVWDYTLRAGASLVTVGSKNWNGVTKPIRVETSYNAGALRSALGPSVTVRANVEPAVLPPAQWEVFYGAYAHNVFLRGRWYRLAKNEPFVFQVRPLLSVYGQSALFIVTLTEKSLLELG